MLVANEAIFMPAILDWNRMYDELNLSCERYKEIFAKSDKTETSLKAQSEHLRHLCNSYDEFLAVLLIAGIHTQYFISEIKTKEKAKETITQDVSGFNFRSFDNWDHATQQFGINYTRLTEINRAYNEKIKGRDVRKMSLQEQTRILRSFCRSENETIILFINTGCYTWNWYVVNNTVNGEDK